jgi:hypothetical protein
MADPKREDEALDALLVAALRQDDDEEDICWEKAETYLTEEDLHVLEQRRLFPKENKDDQKNKD